MTFPKHRRNWKRVQPSNLRDAFRLCKDHAKEKKNLSVERIAEKLDTSDEALYKWLANASMPSGKVEAYEEICGIHLVTEYMAATNGRIIIEIPIGKTASAEELNDLQILLTETSAKLMKFHRGDAGIEETKAELTQALKNLAWHRQNITYYEQPELNLGGSEQ